MTSDRKRNRAAHEQDVPVATENAEMSPDQEAISDFGDLPAKERAVAADRADDLESGGVREQQAYLRWEARVDAEERDYRAERADIHNTPHDQTKNDH